MRETKEGCAPLEDVDEHTFFRVGQYLYTGDYTAADPEILLDSSNVPAENSNPDDELINDVRLENDAPRADEGLDVAVLAEPDEEPAWPAPEPFKYARFNHGLSKKGKKEHAFPICTDTAPAVAKSKKSLRWENFESLSYPHTGPVFKPRKNREACEDYIKVFLGHARLYVFADKYSINFLRLLCLQKLQ